MGLRVWLAKVMMIMHIWGLKENSLANQIWREKRIMGWPGLAKECDMICQELKIENWNDTDIEKKEYRKQALSACYSENERWLRQAMEDKEKYVKIRKELYGRKLYFKSETPSQNRDMFATRELMQP